MTAKYMIFLASFYCFSTYTIDHNKPSKSTEELREEIEKNDEEELKLVAASAVLIALGFGGYQLLLLALKIMQKR